ncbi:peptide chain release factor N(5)-glutamine methyltransferase [Marinivivus vitaminiproducens]|uniref:peptide chain release factor N(5)-glutamine methyltransferase n=1 Tax=Marinivivus vitaminiproducens TaxID=3035935 RepID=UPI0027A6E47E|nr:peptide chain release factor N(5)-glutamine methyltransferase [Geminicoccaceae bacterium SCSIO 64248]
MTEALRSAARRMGRAGLVRPRHEARLLAARVLGCAPDRLIAGNGRPFDAGQAERFERLVDRRLSGEPMAYILGEREFWSLRFTVEPGVLVPRPDSETLVEAALERVAERGGPLRLLDLGTGSGCLLLSLLNEWPDARGLGVDLSAAALAVAAANARSLGLRERARWRLGAWSSGLQGPFDLIVSNPPYIASSAIASLAPDVRSFEPAGALDGGPDGLDAYRAIAPDLGRILAPAGWAVLEVGAGQADDVAALLGAAGLEAIGTRRDLAGIPRAVVARSAA